MEDFDIRAGLSQSLPASPAEIKAAEVEGRQLATVRNSRLRRERPSAQIQFSSLTNAPSRVFSFTQDLTPPTTDVEAGARYFLKSNSDLYHLGDAEVNGLRVAKRYVTDHNGVTHLLMRQDVNGIEVFQGEYIFHFDRNGALLTAGGELIPSAADAVNLARPRLTVSAAFARAMEFADVEAANPVSVKTAASGRALKQKLSLQSKFSQDIDARLVYFPTLSDSLRLAWEFELWLAETPDVYQMVVDAETGALLYRRNLTSYCFGDDVRSPAFRRNAWSAKLPLPKGGTTNMQIQPTPHGQVFAKESPRPNLPIANNNPATVQREDLQYRASSFNGSAIFPANDPHIDWWNGQPPTSFTSNNADAYLDRDSNNQPDDSPRLVVPDGNFVFPLDLTAAPTTDDNQKAALANLFYWTNRYHDILYMFGFNEAAGNFQTTNFTGQGAGNDAVRAEAQDGSGINNANFSTSSFDGSSARVQMYLWTGTPQRDGDLDQGVILHELTHGTSIRLVRGLSGFQQMGEGWSDYFGIALLASPSDNLDGNYAVGQYVTGNYARGIRRFPYSTDPSVYPLNYADITDSVAPHGVGEIWCNTLLEVRAQLIRKLGFTEGQRQSIQLVVDGMKLSVPSPSFLDSRNAIMAADKANNGGANQCAMWTAFAKRGMGFSATTTGAIDRTPIQAFDVPPFCSDLGIVQFDQKAYLLGETVRFTLGDRNATGTIQAKVRSSVTGDEEMVTMTPDTVNAGSYNSSLRLVNGAAVSGDGQLQVSLAARDKIIVMYNDANNGSGAVVQVTAQSDVAGEKTVFDDSVESGNAGWSVSGTPASTWAITDSLAASGTHSWTDSPGANYAAGTNASLVSPLLDLSRALGVTLTFAHRYSFAAGGTDFGIVEFSTNDGATWNRATAFTGTQSTFIQSVLKLDVLAGQSRVRIRFRLSTVSIADGWTIDDIRVVARASDPTFIPPQNQLAPAITGVTPAFGTPGGGTVVTINGFNFTEDGDVKVFFNNAAGVNVRALGSTAIAVNTPAQTAGRASIRVETRYGSMTLLNAFTYYINGSTTGAPDVNGVFPNSGSIKGGSIVTINGANFSPETTVLFGTLTGMRTFINSSTLRVVAPAAATPGAVDLTVRNSATAEKKIAGGFTYTALTPPTVAVLSPAGGEKFFIGTTITLRWQSSDNHRLTRHKVALYRSTATTPQLITNIADLGGESESFNWVIPSSAVTPNGRLQVVAVDDEGAETTVFSSADFTIESRWQEQEPLPSGINRMAATSDGKYFYQIGGRVNTGNSTALTTVQRFDPEAATPAWEALAPLPAPINSGKAVMINGKIYVPGGITPPVEIDRGQFVYDIAGNSWSKMAAPPVGVHAYALAADPANKVYYMTGGSDLVDGVANAQVYNVQTNQWAALPPMGTTRFGHESVFVGGKLYVVGGSGGSKTGEVFDFNTQTWSPIAPMPRAHIYATSALAQGANGRVYWLIIGGEDDNVALTPIVDVYDFADNRWLPTDASFNLPVPRSRPGSAILNGWLYTIGGSTGSAGATTVSTNERFKVDGLTFLSLNQPPLVVVPITQQIALPGQELKFVVSAQDLGSEAPVSISADGIPAGANFTVTNDTNNSAKGTFRWTPVPADVGRNITINFTASDGALTDTKLVQISVIQASTLTTVNAADFKVGPLAVDSIAAAFGMNLASRIEVAQSIPLPSGLADTMLTINGIPAPLFFVSPTQINFAVPAGLDPGSATVIVTNPMGSYALGNIQIVAAAPAIFTANASGTGDAAAQATADGINFQQPPFDVVVNGHPNILVLYGTGIRHVPAANPNDGNGVAESVTVTIDGKPANVQYAGSQGGFTGLDQLNVEFPPSLAGQGARGVEAVVTVGGIAANRVIIQIK